MNTINPRFLAANLHTAASSVSDHDVTVTDTGELGCSCGWTGEVFTDTRQAAQQHHDHMRRLGDSRAPGMTFWFPSTDQVAWLARAYAMIRDGGIWGIPACNARIRVEQSKKTATLLHDGGGDPTLLDRTRTVTRLMGWTWRDAENEPE